MRALRHWVIALAVRALFALFARLPDVAAGPVCLWLAWVAWTLSPALRRVGDANLKRVFESLDAGARRAVLIASGARLAANARQCLRVAAGRVSLDDLVDIPKVARATLRPDPRGTVVATGHIGNWELLGAALCSLGHSTHAVVRLTRNARVAREISSIRSSLGFAEIPRGRLSALRCLRALRRGALVGLLCDQSSDQSSAELEFLGQQAPTALGPALLSRRAGSRLLFAYLRHLPDGRHRLECEELGPSGDDRETMAKVNARLSIAIRADPPSWVWFHNRWPDDPRRANKPIGGLIGLLVCLSLGLGEPLASQVLEPCPEAAVVEHLLHIRGLSYGPLKAQRADLFLPARSRPALTGGVLLLHGGGWDDPAQNRDAVGALARRITCSLGLPVFNADYRLLRDGGAFPENVRDVQRAARWMQSHAARLSIDPGRVVAVGESAGGTLALAAPSMVPRGLTTSIDNGNFSQAS